MSAHNKVSEVSEAIGDAKKLDFVADYTLIGMCGVPASTITNSKGFWKLVQKPFMVSPIPKERAILRAISDKFFDNFRCQFGFFKRNVDFSQVRISKEVEIALL